MSPRDTDPREDPLEEFFARERARVEDLPGGPGHWDELVRDARRPARRRWAPYLAGAAAAVVVGAVAYGSLGPGTGHLASPATQTHRPTGSASGSTSALQPPPTSARTVPPPPGASSSAGPSPTSTVLPAPRSFGIVSLTNGGGRHLYALGRAVCGGQDCTAVVASDDDGATWSTRASFPALTASGAGGGPTSTHDLVGIRFADERIGYVFGGTTLRTLDGGRSWTPVDVGGQAVLSLETDGRQVWMATASGCRQSGSTGSCRGLGVRRSDMAATTTSPVTVPALPRDVDAAWVAMDGSDAYLNATLPPATPVVQGQGPRARAYRLSGDAGAVTAPAACSPGTGVVVSATANSRGTLLGVCPGAPAGNPAYVMGTSTDGGASWRTHPAAGLGAPTPAGIWLTAPDATHLVAIRQGLPGTAGAAGQRSLLVSADGGLTWSEAGLDPAAAGTALWAGAAGGRLVYVVAGGGSYWASTDDGATFGAVPLRR